MISGHIRAVQDRGFTPPRFSTGAYRLASVVGGAYMRFVQGVRKSQVHGMDEIYRAMLRFQEGRTRLMFAFRHVAVADGPLVVKTLGQDLDRWCRAHAKRLRRRPHAHFLYGDGVLNWAGGLAAWTFPRMGGFPVANGRVHKQSQKVLREILTRGEFPLAFAPEGQISYHQFRLFELTGGTGAMASWAHRDLRGAGDRDTEVEILPIAIGYSYGRRSGAILERALMQLESVVRAPGADGHRQRARTPIHPTGESHRDALIRITGLIVSQLEREFPFVGPEATGGAQADLQYRIDRVWDHALACGERLAGLSGEASTLQRVFRLRNWINASVYRDDVRLGELPGLSRTAADRRATIALAAQAYERLADILEYVKIDYLDGPPGSALHRQVEYALNLLDLVNRVAGFDIDRRYEPGRRVAHLVVGDVIHASDAFDAADRTSAGVRDINSKVRSAFESLVLRLEQVMSTSQD